MSTHNIGFYEDCTKIIFELSSNTHLISSAAWGLDLKNILNILTIFIAETYTLRIFTNDTLSPLSILRNLRCLPRRPPDRDFTNFYRID